MQTMRDFVTAKERLRISSLMTDRYHEQIERILIAKENLDKAKKVYKKLVHQMPIPFFAG